MTTTSNKLLQQSEIQKEIERVKKRSLEDRLIVDNFYLKSQKETEVISGKRVVLTNLRNNPQRIVLVIIWTLAQPEYLLDQIIQEAIKAKIPIYFTESEHFISSLVAKKHSASCGIITSKTTYSEFIEYLIKTE